MAITTELVGKLGADKFEVKTVTGLGGSARASVPAGWKSCWVVYQGVASSFSRAEVFGKVSDLRDAAEKYKNIGGGVELSGAQTASVSGVQRGGEFTYIRTA